MTHKGSDKKLYIAMVVGFFKSFPWDKSGGGMVEYTIKMANLLKNKGHDVIIIAGANDDREWMYKGIRILNTFWYGDLNGSSSEINMAIINREIALQRKLREANKKRRIDLVQYAGWSGVGVFHSLHCPAVLRISAYSKAMYANDDGKNVSAKVYAFWEKLSGKRADVVIAPSKRIGTEFSKDIHKNVAVIKTPFAQETPKFNGSEFAYLSNKKYVLFVGSATRGKGFELIMQVIPQLLEQYEELQFVFAGWDYKNGSKSYVNLLREQLGNRSKRFIYLGVLSHSSLYPIIQNAQLVLIPSLKDNFPNTCLEAMGLGQIVVGLKRSSLDEVIVDGESGFLVEPDDIDGLLIRLRIILSMTDNERKRISNNAMDALHDYEPNKCVADLEKIYYGLCGFCK